MIDGKYKGCELFSLSKDLSNHWLRVIKYFSFGEISVYNKEVVTLFKLSSKSEIIIESNSTLPMVSIFFNCSINLSLLISSDWLSLFTSSSRFCFLFLYSVIISICSVSFVGSVL